MHGQVLGRIQEKRNLEVIGTGLAIEQHGAMRTCMQGGLLTSSAGFRNGYPTLQVML